MRLHVAHQFFEPGPLCLCQDLLVIAKSKAHRAKLPARKFQPAKAQRNFLCGCGHANANRIGSKRANLLCARLRRRNGLLDFTVGDDPAGQISGIRQGDSAHTPVQRVVFIEFYFLW